jgi:S1-C subfamily serine protease
MKYPLGVCLFALLLTFGDKVGQQIPIPATQPRQLTLTGTDELALVTVRIETFSAESRLGTATGFFCTSADQGHLFLITNRHVVVNEAAKSFPDHLTLRVHNNPVDLRQSAEYTVRLYRDEQRREKAWREVDPSVDVVAVELNFPEMRRYVFKAFSAGDFITDDVILGLGDPLVIIGYPLGFYDDVFNLPIIRQGAVASVFPVPFKGNRFFLVDANLQPGTSGSPVVTKPSAMSLTRTGTVLGGRMFYLVGVNSGAYDALNLNAVWFTDILSELIR